MDRARNYGEQFERCGLAGQIFFFTVAFLTILSENVVLCHILTVVWRQYWYMEAGNVFQRQQTPVKGGPLRRILQGGWLFYSLYARSQAKTDGEGPSLFSTQNKIWHQNSLRKVWMWRNVSPLNTVGTLLLLLGETIDSLPTKNFVELRSNDVGTTAGRLIPGKV